MVMKTVINGIFFPTELYMNCPACEKITVHLLDEVIDKEFGYNEHRHCCECGRKEKIINRASE